MTAKVLTASRLREGDVVYLTREGGWSPWLADAEVARDPAAAEELQRIGAGAERARLVVGPYLADVAEESAGVRPLSARERIRSLGPTVRTDLGKQAE